MEKFLEFWSHYNAAIIEALVALILISAIYLAYRAFFGSKGFDTYDVAGGSGSDTAQIEKTLQKILEQQSTHKLHSESNEGAGATAGGGAVAAEMVQQLGFLKKSLEEKEKQIVVLQAKATQAEKAAQAGAGGPSALDIAAAASAAAGLAEKERVDYETKIKDLEARLAEYEIISEDIADLSFFKEENVRLTKELEEARAGGGGVAGNVADAPTQAAPPESTAPEVLEPTAPEPTPAPETPMDAAGAIDDSLMAEFAKAVEGQKSGTLGEASEEDENSKLIAEFENFNKKS
jgi:hypothetical protein